MKPINTMSSNGGKTREGFKYSSSPYNFVSFPSKAVSRYKTEEELPGHDELRGADGKKLLSGEIEYTFEAKNPIIVSAGVEEKTKEAHFFKDSNGQFAIPGNTVRGMVRSNLQILSYSSASRDIDDGRFLYRDVAGNGALSFIYKKILNIDIIKRIAKNISAGYVVKRKDGYEIIPVKEIREGIPYFRVDEIKLRKAVDSDLKEINYMYSEDLVKEQSRLGELNKKKAKREVTNILSRYENKGYKPYQAKISFEFDNKGNIVKVGRNSVYSHQGWILSGGYIRGKRSHYIVPEPDAGKSRVEIKKDYYEAYKNDCIRTKKAKLKSGSGELVPERGKEFFMLPEKEGEEYMKPIFYYDLEVLHFGFTPFLRMLYTKSIKDGMKAEYKNHDGISYADSIFGFSNEGEEKYSYRSRVSFEDAVSENGEVDRESTIEMLLATPKATSYSLYLEQDPKSGKKELSVYEGDFSLRGIKQFWLKEYVEQPTISSENMKFKIHPLKPGTEFKGKIHFKNLEEDELGLLLWSIRLEENCYQNIGQAKPYGFGRVGLKDISLKVEDTEKKYSSFSFDYEEERDIQSYIDKYKDAFSRSYLNGKKIEEEKSVKELMAIKSKVVKESERSHYMYMNLKDFADKKVLPDILSYEKLIPSKDEDGNKNTGGHGTGVKGYKGGGSKGASRGSSNSFENNAMALAIKKAKEKKK